MKIKFSFIFKNDEKSNESVLSATLEGRLLSAFLSFFGLFSFHCLTLSDIDTIESIY